MSDKKIWGIGDTLVLHMDDEPDIEYLVTDIGVRMGEDGCHHMMVTWISEKEKEDHVLWFMVDGLMRSSDLFLKGHEKIAARLRKIKSENLKKASATS